MKDEQEYGDRFDEDSLQKAASKVVDKLGGLPGDAVADLTKRGLAVQVIGHSEGGKIQLDAEAIEEFHRRFPDANGTFIAVNAPFDKAFSAEVLEA